MVRLRLTLCLDNRRTAPDGSRDRVRIRVERVRRG